MKSLAEQIREALNRVTETSVTPDDFSFVIEIKNPLTPDADASPEAHAAWRANEDELEDIEVGINYRTQGGYSPARNDEPAGGPEVVEIKIIRMDNAQELFFKDLKKADRKRVLDWIHDDMAENRRD